MLIFTSLAAFPKFTIKFIVKIYINNAKKLTKNTIRIARSKIFFIIYFKSYEFFRGMWSKLTICYESKLDPYILDDVTDDRIKVDLNKSCCLFDISLSSLKIFHILGMAENVKSQANTVLKFGFVLGATRFCGIMKIMLIKLNIKLMLNSVSLTRTKGGKIYYLV